MVFQPTLGGDMPTLGKIDYLLTHLPYGSPPSADYTDDSHVHSCYEIYVNVTGEVSFLYGNEIHGIKPYDVIFSRPGEIHHCIHRAGTPHEHYCLWFSDEYGALSDMSDSSVGHIRLSDAEKQRLSSLLKKLEAGFDSGSDKLICFLSIISLICSGKNLTPSENPLRGSKISEILEYMDLHLAEIRHTSEIADAFYVSPPTLNRLFREETTLSPKKLLDAKRITEAERLLRDGMSVTEACYAVGFSDLSRFISKFKDRFGTTPHKYKAKLKNTK
jgi:AraC-like DNA-binding protein